MPTSLDELYISLSIFPLLLLLLIPASISLRPLEPVVLQNEETDSLLLCVDIGDLIRCLRVQSRSARDIRRQSRGQTEDVDRVIVASFTIPSGGIGKVCWLVPGIPIG